MPTLYLYPFRFRDPLTGKWIRARYKAELQELKARYSEYEIVGAPEVRHVRETSAQPFNPFVAPPRAGALIAPCCCGPDDTTVLHSRAVPGLGASPVAVEVHLAEGLPAFNNIGTQAP